MIFLWFFELIVYVCLSVIVVWMGCVVVVLIVLRVFVWLFVFIGVGIVVKYVVICVWGCVRGEND